MKRPPFPRSTLSRLAAAVICLTAAASLAVAVGALAPWGRGRVAAIARHPGGRTTAGRLSVAAAFRACGERVPAGDSVPVVACGSRGGEEGDEPDLPNSVSAADGLHADALTVLRWTPDDVASLRRAIASLQSAVTLSDRPAEVWADLSAAYLERAGLEQDPHDLEHALNAAQRALALEPGNPAALFNRALALEWLPVPATAARAWADYLKVDRASGWAAEARRRRQHDLSARVAAPASPAPGASEGQVERYVAAQPSAARVLGLDSLLPAWGAARAAGDSARAEALLRLAAQLGGALERQGREASLAEAVRDVRAASGPELARLADSYVLFGHARAAYNRAEYQRADSLFARVAAAGGPSRVLREWASMYRASTLTAPDRYAAADAALRGVIARNDARRYPGLVGLATMNLGTVRGRSHDLPGAVARYEAAEDLLGRAGDLRSLGIVEFNLGEAHEQVGDHAASYRELHKALKTAHAAGSAVALHNTLDQLASYALEERQLGAARALSDANLAAARETGAPAYLVESLITHARVLDAAGDVDEASDSLRAALPLLDLVHDSVPRSFLRADLDLLTAETAAEQDPPRAIVLLGPAVTRFARNPGRLRPALIARARAYLKMGRLSDAVADVDTVLRNLTGQRRLSGRAERLAPADDPSDVAALAVRALVDAKRPTAALALEERARAALALSGPYDPDSLRSLRSLPEVPRDRTVLRLARMGDEVFAWAVRAGHPVAFARVSVPADTLDRTVTRVRAALAGNHVQSVDADLARLYDWLIRPVADSLGPRESTLVILADQGLADVPWAALRDKRRRGHLLIKDYKIRLADSILAADRADLTAEKVVGRVLLVADPRFDTRANRGLQDLPGAQAEVDSIRRLYPLDTVLTGAAATPEAFASLAPGAVVVHFAGHGVADPLSPQRSFLVLAPGHDAASHGRLTAGELDTLRLDSVRLVVLSACESLDPGRGAGGGFVGLGGALLGAGVKGVVGSLWSVDDEGTRALMVAFHRRYAETGDAAGSLREAQLSLIRSHNPKLRSPYVWAAFEYAGR